MKLTESERTNLLKYIDKANEKFGDLGYKYRLDETWMDYGAGIMWETAICTYPDGDDIQMLSPRSYEEVKKGIFEHALAEDEKYIRNDIEFHLNALK